MSIKTNHPEQCTRATEALKEVIDPEIGLNIVDLGLVYRIDFLEEEKRISLDMTLTTQFCPMGEAITDSTREAMQESFPEHTIDLDLVFDPRWDPQLISEEGQQYLNS